MIPLINESVIFVKHLREYCSQFKESKINQSRRINVSYKYDERIKMFHERLFNENLNYYLKNDFMCNLEKIDIFKKKLRLNEVVNFLIKLIIHKMYYYIGFIFMRFKKNKISFRKSYADDIFLVYNSVDNNTLLGVFPFPINIKRHFSFIIDLIKRDVNFTLFGFNYRFIDFFLVLFKRDVGSLYNAERIAAFRFASIMKRYGVRKVELSDEFDIASFDLSLYLRSFDIYTLNKTHGIGKYFPQQAFNEMYIASSSMEDYYEFSKSCTLKKFHLTDCTSKNYYIKKVQKPVVVLIGQRFDNGLELVDVYERELIDILNKTNLYNIYYKPHPNLKNNNLPNNIKLYNDGLTKSSFVIFLSFFSTCQIDPNFKGLKLLIETSKIQPSFAFGDSDHIVNIDDIESYLNDFFCKRLNQSCSYDLTGQVVFNDE